MHKYYYPLQPLFKAQSVSVKAREPCIAILYNVLAALKGSLKGSAKHIYTSTSLRTKDLFSACVEGSGLGRPFDVGTPRSERTVCAALNSIPHISSFSLCYWLQFVKPTFKTSFTKECSTV